MTVAFVHYVVSPYIQASTTDFQRKYYLILWIVKLRYCKVGWWRSWRYVTLLIYITLFYPLDALFLKTHHADRKEVALYHKNLMP